MAEQNKNKRVDKRPQALILRRYEGKAIRKSLKNDCVINLLI
jgi:hypothetical protein